MINKPEPRRVKYLREFSKNCNSDSVFGPSAIQRFCKIGFFAACETMDWGIETGVFIPYGDKGQCRLSETQP